MAFLAKNKCCICTYQFLGTECWHPFHGGAGPVKVGTVGGIIFLTGWPGLPGLSLVVGLFPVKGIPLFWYGWHCICLVPGVPGKH